MEHTVRSVFDLGFGRWLPHRDARPRGRVSTAPPPVVRAVRGVVVWLACVLIMHEIASAIHHGVGTADASSMCMRH